MRHVTCLKPWFRDDTLWRGSCCCSFFLSVFHFVRLSKTCKFCVFANSLHQWRRGLAALFAHLPCLFLRSPQYGLVADFANWQQQWRCARAAFFFSRRNMDRLANLSPCAAKSVMEIGLFTREHQLACPVVSIKIGLFARDHHTHWPGRSRSSHKLARSLAIIIII